METQRDCFPNADFDPAAGVFVAQDHRPASLRDIAPDVLTPFLRALLVIDGTVTKFLEAYAMEPVAVTLLGQEPRRLEDADRWLELPAAARILRRRVMLIGGQTGRLYVFAESLIVPGRLSAPMRDSLTREPGGLGKILLDSELETRREGLWYGREQLADLPGAVRALCDGDFLTRTYRVIAGGAPLMAITERFPIPAAHVTTVG